MEKHRIDQTGWLKYHSSSYLQCHDLMSERLMNVFNEETIRLVEPQVGLQKIELWLRRVERGRAGRRDGGS